MFVVAGAVALAACTVFCLPSTADIFPLVFLEAWACARPVVSGAFPGASARNVKLRLLPPLTTYRGRGRIKVIKRIKSETLHSDISLTNP